MSTPKLLPRDPVHPRTSRCVFGGGHIGMKLAHELVEPRSAVDQFERGAALGGLC